MPCSSPTPISAGAPTIPRFEVFVLDADRPWRHRRTGPVPDDPDRAGVGHRVRRGEDVFRRCRFQQAVAGAARRDSRLLWSTPSSNGWWKRSSHSSIRKPAAPAAAGAAGRGVVHIGLAARPTAEAAHSRRRLPPRLAAAPAPPAPGSFAASAAAVSALAAATTAATVAVGATLGTGDLPSGQSETPAEPQADGTPPVDAPFGRDRTSLTPPR